MNRVFDLATMVLIGAIIADLVTHGQGTKILIDGLTNIWGQSIRAVNPSAA